MVWTIETGTLGNVRWAQWVDAPAFLAWQWRLRDLYALPFLDHAGSARAPVLLWAARDRLAARGAPVTDEAIAAEVWALLVGQWQFLRDVWECLSNLLRALNQPAGACPSYVSAYTGFLGRDPSAPLGPWVDLATAIVERGDAERSRAARTLQRCTQALGPGSETSCDLDFVLTPYSRAVLSPDRSELLARYVDPWAIEAPPPAEGVSLRVPDPAAWVGALGPGGQPAVGFGDYVWAEWFPPDAAAQRLGAVTVLLSGYDTLQLAHNVAITGQLHRRSWREIVARSRLYVVGTNLATAARYGARDAADIARVAAEYEILRHTASDSERVFGAAVEAYSSLFSAINPVYAAIVRGAQVGVEELVNLVGRAQAREVDPFNRVHPYFLPWWISGTVDERGGRPPGFVVPPAPPVDPSRYALASAPPRELPSQVARRLATLALGLPPIAGAVETAPGLQPLDPASVAADAARRWGVDPRRGL